MNSNMTQKQSNEPRRGKSTIPLAGGVQQKEAKPQHFPEGQDKIAHIDSLKT